MAAREARSATSSSTAADASARRSRASCSTQGIDVRLIEPNTRAGAQGAEELPRVRVFNATGVDPDFIERERIGQAQAAVFAMREDAKNLFAASLTRVHGVRFTIAIVHEGSRSPSTTRPGSTCPINPRPVTAEEIVRFAHDPRMQQVSMLEGESIRGARHHDEGVERYVGSTFRDMPVHGALIGAIVRDGEAIFPHGDDVLQAGDRVIVFTEAANVPGRRGPVDGPGLGADRAAAPARSRPRGRPRPRRDAREVPQALRALPGRRRALVRRARLPFVVAGIVTSGVGLALERAQGRGQRVGVREGYLVVSLTWLLAAAFGAIPYLLAGGDQLSSPIDAYFEGMSGFTTTGATVVTDYDELERSVDMWRQFTQWLGGMGIVVLAIAVLPRLRVGGRQMMESELPGPEIAQLVGADPEHGALSLGPVRRADGAAGIAPRHARMGRASTTR